MKKNSASANPKKTVNTGKEGETAVNIKFIEPEGRGVKTPERRHGSISLSDDSLKILQSPAKQNERLVEGEKSKVLQVQKDINWPSYEEIEKAKRGKSTHPALRNYASLSESRATLLMSINSGDGFIIVKEQNVVDALLGNDAKKHYYCVRWCCIENNDHAIHRWSFKDLLEHKGPEVLEIIDVIIRE